LGHCITNDNDSTNDNNENTNDKHASDSDQGGKESEKAAEITDLLTRDKFNAFMRNPNLMFPLKDDVVTGFSHRLAKFVIARNLDEEFGGYSRRTFDYSSNTVFSAIRQAIAKSNLEERRIRVKEYNESGTINKSSRIARAWSQIISRLKMG
jgi:hypothetical protein